MAAKDNLRESHGDLGREAARRDALWWKAEESSHFANDDQGCNEQVFKIYDKGSGLKRSYPTVRNHIATTSDRPRVQALQCLSMTLITIGPQYCADITRLDITLCVCKNRLDATFQLSDSSDCILAQRLYAEKPFLSYGAKGVSESGAAGRRMISQQYSKHSSKRLPKQTLLVRKGERR
ncbi:hypothetical protein AC579_1769 [Pseudocercospora musae]|uniref:Uncharacterized protein n=1 Tax=Pseudocercospora musae TaxID=113226 RepID=A0A139IPF7_9PEZI|nr:hypothetical protein AC579_1769 [Pseudocercospora musae]